MSLINQNNQSQNVLQRGRKKAQVLSPRDLHNKTDHNIEGRDQKMSFEDLDLLSQVNVRKIDHILVPVLPFQSPKKCFIQIEVEAEVPYGKLGRIERKNGKVPINQNLLLDLSLLSDPNPPSKETNHLIKKWMTIQIILSITTHI